MFNNLLHATRKKNERVLYATKKKNGFYSLCQIKDLVEIYNVKMGFSHRKSPKFYKEKFFFFKYIFGILSTEIFSTKKRWVQIVAIFSIKTFPVSS